MVHKDFPALYQASDNASILAQSNYKNIVAYDLISMIIAAILTIYNYQTIEPKIFVFAISGLFLFAGLIMTIVIKTKKYEDIWYQGRALAESCKTLTWRFITCAETFEINVPLEEAKAIFIERLKVLHNEFKELNNNLNAQTLTSPNISFKMLEIRELSLQKRIEYYINNRIENQKKWYATKAEFNKLRYNIWFAVIIITQSIALLCSFYLIKNPNSNWNFVGLFTTISASALSWLQLKQHQELKQAYTTAAQELNFILESVTVINTEKKFSEFVLDSENAISREHTLWLAQKRN